MGEPECVDARPRAHRSTRSWLIIGLVVVVVGAAAGILAWTAFRDDRPQAQAGAVVVAPLNAAVRGSTAEVYVPWGRFELTLGSPREELPELLRDEKRAPDGGGFVGLSLAIGGVDTLLPLPFVEGGRYQTPRATLVADDMRYPVPQLTRGLVTPGGSNLLAQKSVKVFVATADMPKKLSLEITYDGMTQTVSSSGSVTPGRFAALQDVTRKAEPISCGEPHRSGEQLAGSESAECTLTRVGRLPYVAGLGWADSGQEWLVMAAEIEPPDAKVRLPASPRDPDHVDDEYTTTQYSIGGQRPASQVKSNDVGSGLAFADPDDPDQVIFQVAKDARDLRLDITSTFRAHPDGPGIPVSWHVAPS